MSPQECSNFTMLPSPSLQKRNPTRASIQYVLKGLREHLTFVNFNYNILPTLSLKLLIQYQLSQREAFFRRDAYLKFFDGGFFSWIFVRIDVRKMRVMSWVFILQTCFAKLSQVAEAQI